jgi:flavorubredoxin
MPPIEITPNIYWIGVNDRTTDLFEGLWPITQEGVSYNAYLVRDEKTAIVDLAKAFKTDEFFDQIDQALRHGSGRVADVSKLDYVIVNHMEPDHTGVLRTLRRLAPQVTILCSEKAAGMLQSFYSIGEGVRVVQDGETLSLGTHTLRFVYTPFVHWPETMMTYEEGGRILFSCDAFGSYGALRGAIFDDECADSAFYEHEALRYYVNIIAVFSKPVLQAIEKLAGVPVAVIAPSHGLVWRKNPARIVELYRKWAEYATRPTEPGVTLLYASMYGNTEKMMNAVARGVSQEDVPLAVFDVARTHVSYILPALWMQHGVLVGAPTYEGSLFPPMRHALDMAAQKHIRNKKVARFGSYGWSGGAQRDFERIVETLKWELTDSFEFAGGPTEDDLKRGEEFGARFAQLVKSE